MFDKPRPQVLVPVHDRLNGFLDVFGLKSAANFPPDRNIARR
jgi:hypothetical protein